jgi:hypothetical protein
MHANDINRYVVGDLNEYLQYGEDGSLTVYLQHENPGADKESNWLPTNNGPFTLTMRMYIPDGTNYQPPALHATN